MRAGAEYFSAVCFQFMLHLPKNVECDRRRERNTLGGIKRVVAQLSGDTLKQKLVDMMQHFSFVRAYCKITSLQSQLCQTT